jgi:GT2 family glycosyltransferase
MIHDEQSTMSNLASKASVVILSCNRAPELARTVGHMLALPERPRVVVVDNGSTDGSPALISDRFPSVQMVALEKNIGAAARNIGVERVDSAYVAFCDDDTVWAAGSLTEACTLLDAHPQVAVVTARVLVGEEERLDEACGVMAESPLPSVGLPGRAVLGFLAGACIFRRVAFVNAGGYEPRFFIGGEETLLALDLAAAGWSLVYADRLVVHHYPSAYRDVARRRSLLLRNALWTAWLRRPLRAALRETLYTLVRARRDQSLMDGYVEALKGLPWVMRERRVIQPQLEEMFARIEQAALTGQTSRDHSILGAPIPVFTGRRSPGACLSQRAGQRN